MFWTTCAIPSMLMLPTLISTVLLMDADGKELWPAAGYRQNARNKRL